MKHVIAVCDTDERYALNMSALIEERVEKPYVVSTFTSVDALVNTNSEVEVLIISESTFDSRIVGIYPKLIVLRENPDFVLEDAILIDRFQSGEEVLYSVMESLEGYWEVHPVKRLKIHHWKVIGVYSPVRRCLQTSFAMTLGQMLGSSHRVLYMNFENYSGFSGRMMNEFETNIVDLLYFFDCERERLARRIPLTVHHMGAMDILPPAQSYLDTYDRNGERWVEFFEAIEEVTDYDILILDLTDAMQGLLEVMEYCDRIYTLVKNDIHSQAKLAQYEAWMVDHSQASIMGKTMKFSFPEFADIPHQLELLTKSELSAYVNAVIKEDGLDEVG